ncbi:unnamed protein product [Moneuplotes crassus]|uniref:RING-type E3 ubiquitin transferase n=1 Tax=Euplotes crassus TaxID=5936 RepID=A0AAD2CZW7_EUPCR|nr:unnamed protein product [Moneuplotes crassus]
MGGGSSSAKKKILSNAIKERAKSRRDRAEASTKLPSSNHLHDYTLAAQEFLQKREIQKLARERNINLHGKLIKSKFGLDVKTFTLKQSSKENDRYYPRFKYSCTEDAKISIYYCCNQISNSEGVPMYFTIPSVLPAAGLVEVDKGLDQTYEKVKSTSFDISQYENMPLFNSTMSYFPCVITLEPRKKPIIGDDGVSDYQNLITYCVFALNKSTNQIEIKPFKQTLVAFDMAFNLQQIYGINDAVEENKEETLGLIAADDSQLCVVCMTDQKNTVVMPCGHLCVCKDCATTIASQRSPDCPICRKKVYSFVPLNIDSIKNRETKTSNGEISAGYQV